MTGKAQDAVFFLLPKRGDCGKIGKAEKNRGGGIVSTLEETIELIERLPETDQRRVKEFAAQLLGQRHEALPGRKYRRIAIEETLEDDAINTMYAELRIG